VNEHGQNNSQVLERIGGASRARTDGLVVANDALSQLSYSPTKRTNYCTANLFYQRFVPRHSDSTESVARAIRTRADPFELPAAAAVARLETN
jgi:hypothetical protein